MPVVTDGKAGTSGLYPKINKIKIKNNFLTFRDCSQWFNVFRRICYFHSRWRRIDAIGSSCLIKYILNNFFQSTILDHHWIWSMVKWACIASHAKSLLMEITTTAAHLWTFFLPVNVLFLLFNLEILKNRICGERLRLCEGTAPRRTSR
jgi:hypothetical protein